jgi:hypothetical protein
LRPCLPPDRTYASDTRSPSIRTATQWPSGAVSTRRTGGSRRPRALSRFSPARRSNQTRRSPRLRLVDARPTDGAALLSRFCFRRPNRRDALNRRGWTAGVGPGGDTSGPLPAPLRFLITRRSQAATELESRLSADTSTVQRTTAIVAGAAILAVAVIAAAFLFTHKPEPEPTSADPFQHARDAEIACLEGGGSWVAGKNADGIRIMGGYCEHSEPTSATPAGEALSTSDGGGGGGRRHLPLLFACRHCAASYRARPSMRMVAQVSRAWRPTCGNAVKSDRELPG